MNRDDFLSSVEREHDIIEDSNMDEQEKHEAHLQLEEEARREFQNRYSDEDDNFWY